jgi:hypothetical protein
VLSQADCWVKYAATAAELECGIVDSNQAQRMHADWGNNQVLPPAWDSPAAVSALIYLDGPEDGLEGGGTAAVPRTPNSNPQVACDVWHHFETEVGCLVKPGRGAGDPSYARERLVEMPGYGNSAEYQLH